MKAGKAIVFVDAQGDRHEAVCTQVLDDVSPSGAKVVDLIAAVDDHPFTAETVPYVADRAEGDAYWQLTTDPVVE